MQEQLVFLVLLGLGALALWLAIRGDSSDK